MPHANWRGFAILCKKAYAQSSAVLTFAGSAPLVHASTAQHSTAQHAGNCHQFYHVLCNNKDKPNGAWRPQWPGTCANPTCTQIMLEHSDRTSKSLPRPNIFWNSAFCPCLCNCRPRKHSRMAAILQQMPFLAECSLILRTCKEGRLRHHPANCSRTGIVQQFW